LAGFQVNINGRFWVTAEDEDDGRVLIHRHFLIDDQGKERMIFELRMTRK
jgi:hypothetical protein